MPQVTDDQSKNSGADDPEELHAQDECDSKWVNSWKKAINKKKKT